MAVGNVSFDDWLMLTWSLGCTLPRSPRTPPNSSMARLAITSLAFMLLCVPLPVCQTTSGKCASWLPATTSFAACTMGCASSAGSLPSPRFTSAAARLMRPKARIMGREKRSEPMAKFCRER